MIHRLIFLATLLLPAMPGSLGLPSRLFDRQTLRFEENRGQAGAEYRFLARAGSGTLGLTCTGNDLLVIDARVRTRLVGANRQVQLEPLDEFPVKTNFFRGSDPRLWRTEVANYARVRYREVYRGVDLIFYGQGTQLEYDFQLAPNVHPSVIQFAIGGTEPPRISAAGELVLLTRGGEVRWKKPEVYQTIGGKRIPVSGGYRLSGRRVGFRIGSYDSSLPLVIDPVLSFSTYLGSSGNEAIRGMAVDSAGNIYVTGSTTSTDLPAKGTFQTRFAGKASGLPVIAIGDAFVAKFSPAGALLYLTYLGGAAEDVGSALAVDSAGNAYVTGYTNSRDFPVTAGAAQSKFGGTGGNMLLRLGDAFVAKLAPNGDRLIYATYLGGNQDDYGSALAVDAAGNAYIAGGTLSRDFPVTAGVAQGTYGGSGGQEPFPRFNFSPLITAGDAFVAKLNPTGSQFVFATYLGGRSDDLAWGVAVDSTSNVYVAGNTLSFNFPVTTGALQTTHGGTDFNNNPFFNLGDGFVTKLNSSGSAFLYSTYLGGSGDDGISAIALDAAGNVYVTGGTTSHDLPVTANAFQRSNRGPGGAPVNVDQLIGDAFVAKLNPTGTALSFLTYLGGESDDAGLGIALDGSGNVVVTGITQSISFPVSDDALQPKSGQTTLRQGGGGTGFLSILDASGSRLVYSSYFGGTAADIPTSLAVDKSGAVLLSGATTSTDFPVVSASQPRYGGGLSDAFVTRFTGLATLAGLSISPASAALTASNTQQFTATATNATTVAVTWSIKPPNVGSISSGGLYTAPDFVAAAQTVTVTATNVVDPTNSASATVTLNPTPPVFAAAGIVNAASQIAGPVTPGMIVTFSGANFGPPAAVAGSPGDSGVLGTLLGDTRALFDGTPGPMVSAAAGKITAIVPYAVAGSVSTAIKIEYKGVQSAAIAVPVTDAAPALFAADGSGQGQGLILNVDSTPNSAANPASIGDVVTLAGTGEGQTDPPGVDGQVAGDVQPVPVLPVSVTIGGVDAQVVSAGVAPGAVAGNFQVTVTIPDGAGFGDLPVIVTVGTAASQAGITIAVSQPL